MESFESLTRTMPIFYRQHEDVAHGGKVDTLTEAGLYAYFSRRKEEELEVLANTSLIIDYDLGAGPSFSEEARSELKNAFSRLHRGRESFIIHRDGHTVAVIRECDNFLLLDSYNAHGTKDHDHLPLLQIIRKCNPEAKIFTLHDKMQSDYYSCRIFSVENIIEIEKYCRENRCSLSQIIGESELIPPQFYADYDDAKDKFYTENHIVPIGTPIPILHHVQSVKYLNIALNAMLDQGVNVDCCLQKLDRHLRDGKNHTIKDISDENATRLLVLYKESQSLLSSESAMASLMKSFIEKIASAKKSQSVVISV
ncbi:MAG: hypothetical protein PHY80_00290 [Rickettsiales bacterium]|nr:hypothetical protein [Rickettsiales bacterium]